MGTKLTNNATGRLAVSLTAASTQLSMVVGDAVKFPTIAAGSGDNFPLTAVKANGELEIMLCTLTNGNVFTVQRGQEGTSPKAFSAGDRIELRLTAGTIDGMIDDRIDAAIEVVLEDLGSAATRDVGTSPGQLMEVGAFGLGSSSVYNPDITLEAQHINGFGAALHRNRAPSDAPDSTIGKVLYIGDANWGTQLWFSYYEGKVWFRNKETGKPYESWKEFIHTGNLPITASRWPTWAEVTDKPSTFATTWNSVDSKPATATRWPSWGEVSGKPSTFATTWNSVDSKPATATRWPSWGEVTGKPSTFATTWNSVDSKPATATRWPSWGEVTGKPSTFTPPTEHGGVGTYAFVIREGFAENAWGTTVAGSDLRLASSTTNGVSSNTTALSGTWRVMGNKVKKGPQYVEATLAVRIS